MITRIVKMNFRPDCIEDFKILFDLVKVQISTFPGCRSLTMLQDKHLPQTFFTYSIWDDEKALDNYRNSDLFAETWQKTKILFESKALAWTTHELYNQNRAH